MTGGDRTVRINQMQGRLEGFESDVGVVPGDELVGSEVKFVLGQSLPVFDPATAEVAILVINC